MKRGAVVLSAAVVASACTPDAKDSGGKQDQQAPHTHSSSVVVFIPNGMAAHYTGGMTTVVSRGGIGSIGTAHAAGA
jgi:hypothetical protein